MKWLFYSKSLFSFLITYVNLKAESVCKHIILFITSFQTLAVMHDLHYLKAKILPHTNCEHIEYMLSLQPANQHNNSYK